MITYIYKQTVRHDKRYLSIYIYGNTPPFHTRFLQVLPISLSPLQTYEKTTNIKLAKTPSSTPPSPSYPNSSRSNGNHHLRHHLPHQPFLLHPRPHGRANVAGPREKVYPAARYTQTLSSSFPSLLFIHSPILPSPPIPKRITFSDERGVWGSDFVPVMSDCEVESQTEEEIVRTVSFKEGMGPGGKAGRVKEVIRLVGGCIVCFFLSSWNGGGPRERKEEREKGTFDTDHDKR